MAINVTAIFLDTQTPQLFDSRHVDHLKKVAAKSDLGRARYCLHDGEDSVAQSMLICVCRRSLVHIHRHKRTTETFILLEGELEVIFYDDDKNETEVHALAPMPMGKHFMIRIPKMTWHNIRLKTETAIFHEIADGPFRRENTEKLIST